MRWLTLITLALVLPLTACATPRPVSRAVDSAPPYQLDTGDTVKVTVYGDAELTDTYRVDDSGAVAFPLVGPVPVRGATTKQAAGNIAAALANGYMRNPDVAVEVAEYRPFFIQGQIKNGGQFQYGYGMTVRAAISAAGGYTETADKGGAQVYRRQGGRMVRQSVNLDFPIAPGDTIVVGERWF
ncbi:polysaccharide biosynthesis/export family protein [Devosia aquimaris]|uniref:polysaccharide biosynthesis/export family protein n=1 Tax=Devosia aquimaris TaxID=2866214 RepID=UPI001CD12252|nr:polysaccharide biosynthesis/export family protein [Devosia sp. CJK-A8-3]